MAVVPSDGCVTDVHVCASDGISLEMCEDNTSHPVEMPKLNLYPPDYKVLCFCYKNYVSFFWFCLLFCPLQPLPIEECFKECAVFMLQEALELSCGFVDKHPEFVPPGMTRDCAVAVVLYTFGEYCIDILLIVLSLFSFFF